MSVNYITAGVMEILNKMIASILKMICAGFIIIFLFIIDNALLAASPGNEQLIYRPVQHPWNRALVQSADSDSSYISLQREPLSITGNNPVTPAKSGMVVPHVQLDRFADYSIEKTLARLPGFQMNRRGIINLRGIGPDQYSVTVDGQRTGTTGAGDRSFDLGSISTDMVQRVEVIKILTPDMDADGLAGNINLVTPRQNSEIREFDAFFGGGLNSRYLSYQGLGSRAAIRYSEPLREDLSLYAFLTYQQDQNGWESLKLDYDVADFGNGPEDVIERIAPTFHTDGSNRTGGGIFLKFQPSEQNILHLRGIYNSNKRESTRHREILSVNGDWLRADTTGAVGEQGYSRYDMRFQDIEVQQLALQAGASHLFDAFELEYNVGWGQGRFNQASNMFPFVRPNLDFSINMQDRDRPYMTPTNIILLSDGTINRQQLRMQEVEHIVDDHVDNTYSGRVDGKIPFSMGMIHLGTSARLSIKDGKYSNADYDYSLGTRNLFRFGVARSRAQSINVFNQEQYFIPWLIDANDANLFYNSNEPSFTRDETAHSLQSDIWNYSAAEQIYAGYLMTNIELGNFRILVGARIEQTLADYEGRRLSLTDDGLENLPESTTNSNQTDVFPNAQLFFSPAASMRIGLAYSRSVSRPDFNFLAPFERINHLDSTLYRGNPNLKPVVSDNLDLMIEQYYSRVGAVSIGLFHKQLSGFIIERQSIGTDGDLAGFEMSTFDNSEESATVYGAEFSWQHNLSILPGFLGNIGFQTNYTWSRSVFDVAYREDEVSLPGHSPHVVNVALDYTWGRASTMAAYHWTAEALSLDGLQSERVIAPAIDTVNPVYMDRYQYGWKDLSASFRFRISDHFHFWADASNLLGGTQRVEYARSLLYPIETDIRNGLTFNMGIHYRL